MKKPGKVTLVGAGPGAPDLLTLRAVRCLSEADVVLHDRLIATETLKKFAPQARLVYVGKKASYHTLPQDEIEDLLIAEARKGKNVVRLKGGDPFIFGRGGEEAERLSDAGIDFEIVPGVSSAFAAPLFAGIPLTHRAFTPEIAIVTGHENPDKGRGTPYRAGVERAASSWIHWPTLAQMGTIVFLMGMGNLRANMQKLVENGLDPETPAAVVRWGGTPKQKSVVATVATIADRSKERGLKAPAVIVVGKAVGLAKKLNWFEKRPFYGMTFLLTRAPQDNAALAEAIERESGRAILWPSYKYVSLPLGRQDRARLANIHTYDWIVFTSARAVDYFLNLSGKKFSIPLGAKIAAVGKKTAASLMAKGVSVDLVAKDPSAAGLAKERVFATRTKKLKILLPQARDARGEFFATLHKRHCIDALMIYRKQNMRHATADKAALLARHIDWVLFFSPSAVDAFLKNLGKSQAMQILTNSRLAVIGKTTAAYLHALGLSAAVVSKSGTVEDLLARISACRASLMNPVPPLR